MYRKIEDNQRMTENEACLKYPDSYILMQRDNRNMFNPTGVVLYVGDEGDIYILRG